MMLQILLITVLAAEIVGYVWLTNTLFTRGWSGVAIAGVIVLIAFCWRLSHATGSATVSGIMRLRQGRHDAGMGHAFWGEFTSRLTSFNVAQPFHQ